METATIKSKLWRIKGKNLTLSKPNHWKAFQSCQKSFSFPKTDSKILLRRNIHPWPGGRLNLTTWEQKGLCAVPVPLWSSVLSLVLLDWVLQFFMPSQPLSCFLPWYCCTSNGCSFDTGRHYHAREDHNKLGYPLVHSCGCVQSLYQPNEWMKDDVTNPAWQSLGFVRVICH